MKREIGHVSLLNLISEFCEKLGSEYDEMSIQEFRNWWESNHEEGVEASKQYLEYYGEESVDKENCFLNEYDYFEDEVRKIIEWKESLDQSDRGRPSKVDEWESRIRDGSATLEEARSDMSDPTWYKLKERIEE
jgi:hypothetical protein